MSTEKAVDWAAIEKHYRAGLKSLRTIAEEYGITEGAIRKRAKRDHWARDLEKRIQERAKDKVRKSAVRAQSTQLSPQTEIQVVEQYSDIVAAVDEIQREDIRKAIDNTRSQLEELAALGDPEFRARLEWLGEVMDESGPTESGGFKTDKANELYRYIISLAGRIKMSKEVAGAYGVYIPIQRKIFGLEGERKNTSEYEDLLRRIAEQAE